MAQGMIELVAVGTAVRRAPSPQARPATPTLMAQAVIVERDSLENNEDIQGMSPTVSPMRTARALPQRGCLAPMIIVFVMITMMCLSGLIAILAENSP
jgi:hypothetical protein